MDTLTNTNLIQEIKNIVVDAAKNTCDEVLDRDIIPKAKEKFSSIFGFIPEIHEIKTETSVKQIIGVMHEKFDEVLKIVNADIPVYLSGKAGCGNKIAVLISNY